MMSKTEVQLEDVVVAGRPWTEEKATNTQKAGRRRFVKEFEQTEEGREKLRTAQKRFEEDPEEREDEPKPKSRKTEEIPVAQEHSAEKRTREEDEDDSSSSSSSSSSSDDEMQEAPPLDEPVYGENRGNAKELLQFPLVGNRRLVTWGGKEARAWV